jgi:hypothetical protein
MKPYFDLVREADADLLVELARAFHDEEGHPLTVAGQAALRQSHKARRPDAGRIRWPCSLTQLLRPSGGSYRNEERFYLGGAAHAARWDTEGRGRGR